MKIDSIAQRQHLGRKVQGMAAGLLPFEADGRIAVEAFQNHLRVTHDAGLVNAVNMDTGYVNYLSDSEKQDVLRWTRCYAWRDSNRVPDEPFAWEVRARESSDLSKGEPRLSTRAGLRAGQDVRVERRDF